MSAEVLCYTQLYFIKHQKMNSEMFISGSNWL